MPAHKFGRTLSALGFHSHPHANEPAPRAVFGNANGEEPTPLKPWPPARIPPHMRHLYPGKDEAPRGYSIEAERPTAAAAPNSEKVIAKTPTKARKRPNGAPKGVRIA